MTETPQRSFLASMVGDLDDNRSPIYITIALLFYLIPVILVSFLFITAAVENYFLTAFVGLAWVVIVILPLMLTFGVFIVYRATYSARTPERRDNQAQALSEEEQQWDHVINKALDWHRFLMPLCLLNMFITLISGFLVFADISTTGDLMFGSYTINMEFLTSGADMQSLNQKLNLEHQLLNDEAPALTEEESQTYLDELAAMNNRILAVPGSIFYLGILGFMVQFLDMTRRRYVSRNIVPRFYLMNAFRLLQVLIAVFVIYLFLRTIIDNPPRDLVLLSSFIVGMFPIQVLTPVLETIGQRLGMSTNKELPITMINGIDNTLESLLQEENIDSIQILATTDIDEINKRTAIPKATLSDWQRQARLFDVLGTQSLIDRFARIGINDFDDLGMLVQTMGSLPLNSAEFQANFTTAMLIKSDDDAINTDAFWKVLVQVLIREYIAEFPDTVIERVQVESEAPLTFPVAEVTSAG